MSLTNSTAAEEDDFEKISATSFQKIQTKALKVRTALAQSKEKQHEYDVNVCSCHLKIILKFLIRFREQLGYIDGLSDGRDRVFQSGFDLGYTDGLRTGFEIEKFKAFCGNLDIDKLQNAELLKEKSIYEEKHLPDVKDKTHFKYLNHQQENLQTISKHQQSYVNDFLEDCQIKLPLTTNLLKGTKMATPQ